MTNAQRGFTLIELLIVVAIIGILAMIAIPAYQSYTIRAQVSEGLALLGPLKLAVAAYRTENGVYPVDNAAAVLEPPGAYTSKYVDSISVSDEVISILYGNEANARINGQSVTMTATYNQGSVTWTCASGGFISGVYLPSACR